MVFFCKTKKEVLESEDEFIQFALRELALFNRRDEIRVCQFEKPDTEEWYIEQITQLIGFWAGWPNKLKISKKEQQKVLKYLNTHRNRLLQELPVGAKFIYENKVYELVDKTLVTSPRFYPRYTCINVKTGKKKTIAKCQSVQPVVEGD